MQKILAFWCSHFCDYCEPREIWETLFIFGGFSPQYSHVNYRSHSLGLPFVLSWYCTKILIFDQFLAFWCSHFCDYCEPREIWETLFIFGGFSPQYSHVNYRSHSLGLPFVLSWYCTKILIFDQFLGRLLSNLVRIV